MLTLSIIVPCFNEQEVLPDTTRRLIALLDDLNRDGAIAGDSQIIYVDDGSSDGTWHLIETQNKADSRVKGIKLSRNRGHQNALLAGLLTASGDVLISIDADLQDDIAAIPRMLAEHAAGAEIVFGVRSRRDTDTLGKRLTARLYYRLLRRFGVDVIPDHADFRLMSRRAIESLRDFREVNLFLRGIVPMLGFRTATVEYARLARKAGCTKYPFSRMLSLAIDGITSFSTVPLQWITVTGVCVSIGSVALGFWSLYERLFTNRAIPGWASTVVPIYFLGGLQLMSTGVLGMYVARIYAESKMRPRFIIERCV